MLAMLERRLLFSHILPINGLCLYRFKSQPRPVFIRVVSATPPSIVIVALVLGGLECVRARARCVGKQQHARKTAALFIW